MITVKVFDIEMFCFFKLVGCYQSSAAFNSYEDNIHIDIVIIVENSSTIFLKHSANNE